MLFVYAFNFVCTLVTFFSSGSTWRGRLITLGVFLACFIVPGIVAAQQGSREAVTIAGVALHVTLAIYFAFRFGIAGQRLR